MIFLVSKLVSSYLRVGIDCSQGQGQFGVLSCGWGSFYGILLAEGVFEDIYLDECSKFLLFRVLYPINFMLKNSCWRRLRWARPTCTIGIRTNSNIESLMYLIQILEDFLWGSEQQFMKKYFGIIHWECGLGKKQWPNHNRWWGGQCGRWANKRGFSTCRLVIKTYRNLVFSKRLLTKASGRNVVCFKRSLAKVVAALLEKALSIKVERWPSS